MKIRLLSLLAGFGIMTGAVATPITHDNGNNVIWTAAFENVVPRSLNVTQDYCNTHVPAAITTNIRQIKSQVGVVSTNGVGIRYLSYQGKDVDGLHFNIVNGIVFGKTNDKSWQEPIKLYEQTLNEIGKTWAVWSTPNCKGTLIGYPTIVGQN